jgi:hypothetical protein
VIYPDAFAGGAVKADVRLTYTRAAFEADVILRTRPAAPETYGLSSKTTRLQVWTEFISPPQPAVTTQTVPSGAGDMLADQQLDFGTMQVGPGQAFLLGNQTESSSGSAAPALGGASVLASLSSSLPAPIGKQWVSLAGRQFLVEEVALPAIARQLDQLPAAQGASLAPAADSVLPVVSTKPRMPSELPELRLAMAATNQMKLAKGPLPARGLVLDYQMCNGSLTNCNFQGDTTYFVSGRVYLYKTNTFEGGTVIKYTNTSSACIQLQSGSVMNCQGSAYRPIVMTSMNDDSVGETISESTGNPSVSSYTALNFQTSIRQTLSHIRVAYAGKGMEFNGVTSAISDAQFVNCGYGLWVMNHSSSTLKNALFSNVTGEVVMYPEGSSLQAYNVTFDQSGYLCNGLPGDYFYAVNCIVANVASASSGGVSLYGIYNGFYNSPPFGANQFTTNVSPFQEVGGGRHYLRSDCCFRHVGTTGIGGDLLADLKTKTTQPPIELPIFMYVTGELTLFPQVPRYTSGPPDLGYYYDALDYTVAGMILEGANVTVEPGTVTGLTFSSHPES